MSILIYCSYYIAKKWQNDKEVKLETSHGSFTKPKHMKHLEFPHFQASCFYHKHQQNCTNLSTASFKVLWDSLFQARARLVKKTIK